MRSLLLPLLLVSSLAVADEHERTYEASEEISVGQAAPSDVAEGWVLPPGKTGTVTGEFAFLTSHDLEFTDVGLLRLHGDYSIKGRVEIAGGVELLAKEPSSFDEGVFQRFDAAARLRVGPSWAARLGVAGGPMMQSLGKWGQLDLGFDARHPVDEIMVFAGSLGVSGMDLAWDGRSASAFAEAVVSGQVQFKTPETAVAAWLGVEWRAPIVRTSMPGFDPRVRLGLDLGAVYAFAPTWDFYLDYSIIDRGDRTDPTTTLPILDGGFDQQQFLIGVTRHFPARERHFW